MLFRSPGGRIDGHLWFDDIWLTAVDLPNLVANGLFESGLSPWHFVLQGAAEATETFDTSTFETGTQSLKVNVTAANSNAYDVQLGQVGLYIPSGTAATVSFWAKASASIPVQFIVQEAASPYTAYYTYEPTLTTSWANYGFTFTSSSSAQTAFVVNYAATAGTVWLDNVGIWDGALP